MAQAGQARSGWPRNRVLHPISTIKGASWLFPLKGIYYFCKHPFLWPLLRRRLLPCTILSVVVLATLFIWTYIPQVAFLAIFHGPHLAFINGAFLVLGEAVAITALLFEAMFVDETLVDVFDAVLLQEGHEGLIAPARLLNPPSSDPVSRLGKPTESAIYSPFSLRQILEFILFLPFNLIPIVGTPLFLLLTGYRAGPFHHWRYFKLLGLTRKDRKLEIRRRQLKYTWFGTVALILQLVPVLSMFFLLTTAAGSALWVAQLEHSKMQQTRSSSVNQQTEIIRSDDHQEDPR